MKILLATFVAALFNMLVFSASYAVDLVGAYSLALTQDASLQLAKQQYLIEQQTAIEGKSLLKPALTASARFGKVRYQSDAPDISQALEDINDLPGVATANLPANCQSNVAACLEQVINNLDGFVPDETKSNYRTQEYNLNLTQPLYDKERWHHYKKAQLLGIKGELVYRQAKAELTYRVAEAYLTALQAVNNLEQGRAEKSALQRQLRYAKAQLQQGIGRASELYQLRSADQLQNSQTEILKTGLNAALAELSGLTGRPITLDRLKRFQSAIPVTALSPRSKKDWIALARKHNAHILSAGIDVRLADEQRKLKKGARLPKVNLAANYNKTDTSGGQGFIPGAEIASAGIDVSAPLYLGGRLSAGHKKAQYQLEAAKQKYRQDLRRLEISIDALYSQITGNINNFSIYKDSLAAAVRADKNLSAGASKGVVSVAELLANRKKISQMRSQLEAVRYEYLLNKLKLRRLVGVLDERDLHAINTLTR